MRWLADNYKTYWGEDIDTSKIGLIPITFSRVTGINDRVPGMTDVFKECFPESADNIYIEDLVQTSFSVDGAYEQISTRLVATQEIEHWFIIAAVDDWATGALRATEAIDAVDKVLITCCQGNAFVNEMKTGYSGDCWVSCCYVPEKEFSEYMAAGLVALMDGRATVETLWPDAIAEGDKAPNMQVRGTMVTRDTLDDFLASQVISF